MRARRERKPVFARRRHASTRSGRLKWRNNLFVLKADGRSRGRTGTMLPAPPPPPPPPLCLSDTDTSGLETSHGKLTDALAKRGFRLLRGRFRFCSRGEIIILAFLSLPAFFQQEPPVVVFPYFLGIEVKL